MPTYLMDTKKEMDKKVRQLKKKGYPGVYNGKNTGGRKKYYVTTRGRAKKN